MTTEIEHPALDLQQRNARLVALVDSLAGQGNSQPITPQVLSTLSTELKGTRALLQNPAGGRYSSRDEQLACRRTLERLQSLLREMYARLLAEQARLDRDRAHFEAAARWHQSSRLFTP